MSEKRKSSIFRMLPKKAIIVLCIVIGIAALSSIIVIGISNYYSSEGDTVSLGFEDIGEFVTQSVSAREVETIETAKEVWGHKIPFTESKVIFSYIVDIKAGYNFTDIEYEVDETAKKILVKLPEVKVLDSEVDTESFEEYYEKESIFKSIEVDEFNASLDNLVKRAQDNAINNGLFDKARANAEVLLKGFFSKGYDLQNEYMIEFY